MYIRPLWANQAALKAYGPLTTMEQRDKVMSEMSKASAAAVKAVMVSLFQEIVVILLPFILLLDHHPCLCCLHAECGQMSMSSGTEVLGNILQFMQLLPYRRLLAVAFCTSGATRMLPAADSSRQCCVKPEVWPFCSSMHARG